MNWKKNPASSWQLYCIIDGETIKHKDPVKIARSLFKSGVEVIQLRYKNYPSYKLVRIAKDIQKVATKLNKFLLIDDRVDVALASGAGGVHLGSGDLPLGTARHLLKPKSIAGKTVHSVSEAKKTQFERPDYVSAGPIFSTPLKKNLKKKGTGFIKRIKKSVSRPLFAIGGINKRNARSVFRSGADGICVTRGIFEARALLREIKK